MSCPLRLPLGAEIDRSECEASVSVAARWGAMNTLADDRTYPR